MSRFGGSTGSLSSGGSSSKAVEAQLLSQATSTAVVAARSILMAGGSEDVALMTAKAAAESVLIPSKNTADGETLSGRSAPGMGFLRRRKMRRQAEVVASMALVAASNDIRNGITMVWGDSNPGSIMGPYASNITTRSMHTADEPSVLSGSTRLCPRGPSPSTHSRTLNPFVLTEKNGTSNITSPLPPLAGQPLGGPSISGHVSSLSSKETVHDEDVPTENVDPSTSSKMLDTEKASKFEQMAPPLDNPIFTDDSADKEDTPDAGQHMLNPLAPSGNEGDYDDEATLDPSVWTNARNNPWTDFDPLLTSVTDVFNLLTCGPMIPKQQHGSSHFGGAVPRRIAHHAHDFDTIASAIDTMETRDDAATDFRSMYSSYDQTETKDHFGGRSGSSAETTVDSFSILQELESNDASEGNIQVRSSIRDTMERIVSKTEKAIKNDLKNNEQWKSYELRETTSPRPTAQSSQSKRKPLVKAFAVTPKGAKKSFFFSKRGLKN
jgi:hypothetical protein